MGLEFRVQGSGVYPNGRIARLVALDEVVLGPERVATKEVVKNLGIRARCEVDLAAAAYLLLVDDWVCPLEQILKVEN